jgi:predicted TIM-barrel fold metal-dependent hydrolase
MTAVAGSTLPPIISVDDHVVEPPDLWASRLPRRLVERGPRVVRERGQLTMMENGAWTPGPDGAWADIWYFDGLVKAISRMSVAVGLGELGWGTVTFDEMRPGAWKQADRLADMDANHVEVSVCFPNTLPRFCGQTFAERPDKELALLCVRAYNDWMIDEWCAGPGRGRLIPLTIVPLWDPALAAAEIRRCAAKASYAITFPENPDALGLPSVHTGAWDPVFRACEETATTLCMHIGSSSRMPRTSQDAPFIVSSTLAFQNCMGSVLDFVFSGVLHRFPGLTLAYSEGQVGWMPYLLERADKLWAQRSGNSFGSNGVTLDKPPSAYVRAQVYGCIFDDETGLELRDRVGMSQICFETDFPHADGTFPHSRQVATDICAAAGLDAGETYALLRGNAITAFGLQRFGITA